MSKNLIKKAIIESIMQEYTVADEKEFESALSDLATLDLEDNEVRYPKIDGKKYTSLFSVKGAFLYLLGRTALPESGPFEIMIENIDDDIIGFIRGTKNKNIISFNLIHIKEDYRGRGIGSDIYEEFLSNGFIIKSDSEITDSTYSIYYKLVKYYDYIPLLFDDDCVGIMKKP